MTPPLSTKRNAHPSGKSADRLRSAASVGADNDPSPTRVRDVTISLGSNTASNVASASLAGESLYTKHGVGEIARVKIKIYSPEPADDDLADVGVHERDADLDGTPLGTPAVILDG